MLKTFLSIIISSVFLFSVSPGYSQDTSSSTSPTTPSAVAASTDAKIEALASEIERMKVGMEVLPPITNGKFGLAPAASKVYLIKQGVSIGGYGEMVYNNIENSPDQADALRFITYVGYKFSPRFLFNSEVEFEHGSTENAGSVSVEFANLDFLWKDELNVRAGLLLLPMGFINEIHEPTTFLGVGRPETERRIIPTTWREMGLGIFGENKHSSYRTYVVTGLDAVGGGTSNAGGFDANGIREGRQNGSKAIANDFAFVGRYDFIGLENLKTGASLYWGKSGQNSSIDAWTTIAEGHAEYKCHGLEFRGLLAYAHVTDTAAINAAQANAGPGIAEDMLGGYAQLGFNVLSLRETSHTLVPFFRYEYLNTQQGVESGQISDPARDRDIYTLGLVYKPIPQIVAKFDYQWNKNEAGTGADQWNLGLGYMF